MLAVDAEAWAAGGASKRGESWSYWWHKQRRPRPELWVRLTVQTKAGIAGEAKACSYSLS